ncbi:MAG: hypothetical protein ACRED1_01905 [Limisphaerales bacterium]
MKSFCLAFLAVVCGVAMAAGQTNSESNGVNSILALVTTNLPPATNRPPARPRQPLAITAAGPCVGDMNTHCITYSENVCVTNDEIKLTCQWLKAEFSGNWQVATNIVAKTNVVVDYTDPKGQKGRALGDKALYIFKIEKGVTNETITLTGNPPEILEGPGFTNRTIAKDFVYDLITRKVRFDSPSGRYWPSATGPGGSNSHSQTKLSLPK